MSNRRPSLYQPPPASPYDLVKQGADDSTLLKVPDKEGEWPRAILSAFDRSYPWASDYDRAYTVESIDAVGGSGTGFITLSPKIHGSSPAPALRQAAIRVPWMVQQGRLLRFYVFECAKKFYGLTPWRVQEMLLNPQVGEAPEVPVNIHRTIGNQMPPAPYGNMQSMLASSAGFGTGGSMRLASAPLSHALEGFCADEDRAAVRAMAKESAVAELLATPGAAGVRDSLDRLLAARICPQDVAKTAADLVQRQRPTVLQVTPTAHGYHLKWADGEAFAPQEADMGPAQAQQQLPPELLQQADQQGVATLTMQPTTPDPMETSAEPIQRFGLYRCHRVDTGDEVVGFVFPGVFDYVTNAPGKLSIFTNGSSSAQHMGNLYGSLVAVSGDVPASPRPIGLGIFFSVVGNRGMATMPVTIQVPIDGPEGRSYAGLSYQNTPLVVKFSPAVQRPTMVPPTSIESSATLILPEGWRFLQLGNPLQLKGGPPLPTPEEAAQMEAEQQAQQQQQQAAAAQQQQQQQRGAVTEAAQRMRAAGLEKKQQGQPQQQAQQPAQQQGQQPQPAQQKQSSAPGIRVHVRPAADSHSLQLRVGGGGRLFQVGGSSLAKLGSAEVGRWVDMPEALFRMAAVGVQQNVALELLKVAYERGSEGFTVWNVRPIRPASEVVGEAIQTNVQHAKAASDLARSGRFWKPPMLFKEALALAAAGAADPMRGGGVDGGSLDSLLSLGFMNPENLGMFVENIPALEEASSALASIVLATQLGIRAVPLAAAVRGMQGLDRTIQSLKVLAPTAARA